MRNRALRADELKGCYVPVITPMTEDQEIDFPKLDKLVLDCLASGVDGFVPCGTTGQSATLSPSEQVAIVERVFNLCAGRAKIIANAGSNSTREAITLSRAIEERIGPTTLLHVTGYYNAPPQAGLIKHYVTLAESLMHEESNIVLYNVPSRTTSNILATTAIELAKHPKIIGVKEASGNIEQVEQIIKGTDSNSFRVLSGEDKLTVKIIELGGFGVISAAANAAPLFFSKMTNLALEAKKTGDFSKAYKMQERINLLIDAVFCAKNPIPLHQMFGTYLRLPLCRVDEVQNKIDDTLAQYDWKSELGIDFAEYQETSKAKACCCCCG